VNSMDQNPPSYFCDLAAKQDFATHDIYSPTRTSRNHKGFKSVY
jgi:hypothetical protein